MYKYKFTILLVTYNPVWEKIVVTLESVLRQQFKDFEIVVSDDGSENNLFDKIEDYFKLKGFEDYTLVPHKENQGTVKNLIDGLKASKGKYVRDFGPGDAFYNEKTLGRLYWFMEKKQCEGCFGLMRGYGIKEDGDIDYIKFMHPFDLLAYRKKDEKKIVENLVLYRDNASGACTCYKKDYYLEYLLKLVGTVKYVEDIFQLMAGLDGRRLEYFPDYIVWYEADTGVSTKKKSSFSDLLAKDVDNFYLMLHEKYPDAECVKKQKKVYGLYKIRNLYVRTIIRFFVNPGAIPYLVSHYIQTINGTYKPYHNEKGFFENETYLRSIGK